MKWLIIIFSIIAEVFIFSWIKEIIIKKKGERGEEIINDLRKIFAKNPKSIYRPPNPIVEIYKGAKNETK